jgi:2-polyprenyl-3-methyl-5-hydroxy-6-metoxy-1,4-benzoquinol methylase
MPTSKVIPFDYQNSIFSPDIVCLGQLSHSGYINFKRLYDFLKTQNHQLKILDIGCGAGAMIASLQKTLPQHQYNGIDISAKAIEYGKSQYKNINLDIIKSGKIDFPSSSIDLVIISEVLEHVDDYKNILEKATEILKKDGFLYLTSPLEKSLTTVQGIILKTTNILLSTKTTGHINTFTKKSIFEILNDTNLRPIRYSYSQHLFWQISMTVYQILLIALKKDVSLHRPSRNNDYSYLNPFGILIKTVSFITNIESMILKKVPGSDIQIICRKY